MPWSKGKSFDTFTPVGPYLVTGIDPGNLAVKCSVNGQVKQDENTADMVFSVSELVSFLSAIMTLEPGDLILTGTPPGGGELNDGDLVECSSPLLGNLANKARFVR
jgi:2-keto-4-pentenoate hydratase/2-oxohepta-3-ene-1,7-dioic acid hydratase in catechol pathway